MHPENDRVRLDVTSRLPTSQMLSPGAGSFTKAKESARLLYIKQRSCLRSSLESRSFFKPPSPKVLSIRNTSPATATPDRVLSALGRLILTQIKEMFKLSLRYTFRSEHSKKAGFANFQFQSTDPHGQENYLAIRDRFRRI